LGKINRHYKEYFDQYSISPILKINVDNLDFENNLEHRQIVINKIKEYLKK